MWQFADAQYYYCLWLTTLKICSFPFAEHVIILCIIIMLLKLQNYYSLKKLDWGITTCIGIIFSSLVVRGCWDSTRRKQTLKGRCSFKSTSSKPNSIVWMLNCLGPTGAVTGTIPKASQTEPLLALALGAYGPSRLPRYLQPSACVWCAVH